MKSMSPHGTFSLESLFFNFQILAPKCVAPDTINKWADYL